MTFNEYDTKAFALKAYPDPNRFIYTTMKLCGEAGEVAEKIGKSFRGDYPLESKRDEIVKELGDVLWYINAIANEFGSSLEEVAAVNLNKLYDRKDRGVLKGDGDNR